LIERLLGSAGEEHPGWLREKPPGEGVVGVAEAEKVAEEV